MRTLTDRVQNTVGRHFVTLSCVHRRPGTEGIQIHVFSGFVVDVAGEWFYMTAGHILRDIRQALDAGSTFDIWRLGDQTAGNHFGNIAVPYAFDIEQWCVLEDANAGLDYAAVHLGGLYRLQLEAGGVAAIARNAWSDHLTEYDHWVLIGTPAEAVSYDGRNLISARVVIAPLLSSDPPPLAEQKAQNQFYARLADGSEQFVSDVVGMSGGPVFMLKYVDGTWKYSIIGVQSAWYPSLRVVAVCPFATFGHALEPIVKEALVVAQQAQPGPGAA